MMTIAVKLFGPLREITKQDQVEIEVKVGVKVEDLLTVVGKHFPGISAHLQVVSCSVGNEYVAKDTPLQNGDVVGLLPPISGG